MRFSMEETELGKSRRVKRHDLFFYDDSYEKERYKADMQSTANLPIPGIAPAPEKVRSIPLGYQRKFK